METIPPATRRANRWLFTALIIFAVTLAIVCLLWMRGVVRNNGGIVDPQPRTTSLQRTGDLQPDFIFANHPAVPYLIS